MRFSGLGFTGGAVAAVCLLTPGSAGATSCAVPRGYDPFRAAHYVAEGVLLSGPSRDGVLFSPARLSVSRYLKGAGPSVLAVRTIGAQVAQGDLSDVRPFAVSGTSLARAGEGWRVYGYMDPRRMRETRHAPVLGSVCTDHHLVAPRRVLDPIGGSLRRVGSGRGRWQAKLFSGPGRLRCLRLGRHPQRIGAHAECRSLRRARTTLVAVRRRSAGSRRTTAVALAARGLRSVEVLRASDSARSSASAPRGVALVVLPGASERGDLAITARYRNGSTRSLGASGERALDPGEGGGRAWAADLERLHNPLLPGGRCVALTRPDNPWRSIMPADYARAGACGNLRRRPFFFAVSYVRENPPAVREGEPGVRQTLVFGGLGRAVEGVTIRVPAGERHPAISLRGRSFIATYQGKVAVPDISLEFRLRDQTLRTFSGQRSANLVRASRVRLW